MSALAQVSFPLSYLPLPPLLSSFPSLPITSFPPSPSLPLSPSSLPPLSLLSFSVNSDFIYLESQMTGREGETQRKIFLSADELPKWL